MAQTPTLEVAFTLGEGSSLQTPDSCVDDVWQALLLPYINQVFAGQPKASLKQKCYKTITRICQGGHGEQLAQLLVDELSSQIRKEISKLEEVLGGQMQIDSGEQSSND